jgi:surfactin synthase thioesterase subunit
MTAVEGSPVRTKWLLGPVRTGGRFRLFGFPYPGAGASSFREWPQTVGAGTFHAVQPPGRENRIAEPAAQSLDEFADSLIDAINPYLDEPYAFIGHCGAFDTMLHTTLRIRERGLSSPAALFASAWGAPHTGPHGWLSDQNLDDSDFGAQVVALNAKLGRQLPAALTDIAVNTMRNDLLMNRSFRYGGTPRVPCPVEVVAWSEDTVVPPTRVWPGWQECADVTFHLLPGDHGAFLRFPAGLAELVLNTMQSDEAGRC